MRLFLCAVDRFYLVIRSIATTIPDRQSIADQCSTIFFVGFPLVFERSDKDTLVVLRLIITFISFGRITPSVVKLTVPAPAMSFNQIVGGYSISRGNVCKCRLIFLAVQVLKECSEFWPWMTK